ncbi:MAG: hypothetical protein Q4F84_00620 [Fibrobacter sp.]|nr:hypothetical protein [Fibrobacter sp.]
MLNLLNNILKVNRICSICKNVVSFRSVMVLLAKNIIKTVPFLCAAIMSCESENPVAADSDLEKPCVLPCTVTDGVGTSLVVIGMTKDKVDQNVHYISTDTLSGRFYYNYLGDCDDKYTVEYSDSNTVRSIGIESERIKCALNITNGTTRENIESVYGSVSVTQVYQTLNALYYDIEGIIFFVDDITGLESVKILAPKVLVPVRSGYGSNEININSTKESLLLLDSDSIIFTPKSTYESVTLIYQNEVYGLVLVNDTTVSRVFFGSDVICDSMITKRSTREIVESNYGQPDAKSRLETLDQDVYSYIYKGVDFIFDSLGYVIQTVIYPPQKKTVQ